MCWLTYTNLQNKTQHRRPVPFGRSQKNQHKCIVCLEWKLQPIINRRGLGIKNVVGGKKIRKINYRGEGTSIRHSRETHHQVAALLLALQRKGHCVVIQTDLVERNSVVPQ